jgi:hypothetical protein
MRIRNHNATSLNHMEGIEPSPVHIFSSCLGFVLKNLKVTNKTSVPLTKNNNKILFYIKKIIIK